MSKEAALSADFTRTCKGCKHVRKERIPKVDTVYRCFADGPTENGAHRRGRQAVPPVCTGVVPGENEGNRKLRYPKGVIIWDGDIHAEVSQAKDTQ